MNANAQLISVIEDIYDTTFDQSLRNNALMRVAEYASAQSAGLVTSQSGDKGANGEVHRSLLLAVRGADMSVMHPPSLRAKRSNPGPPDAGPLDCFVASLLGRN